MTAGGRRAQREILARADLSDGREITVARREFRTGPLTAVTWTSADGGPTWSLQSATGTGSRTRRRRVAALASLLRQATLGPTRQSSQRQGSPARDKAVQP